MELAFRPRSAYLGYQSGSTMGNTRRVFVQQSTIATYEQLIAIYNNEASLGTRQRKRPDMPGVFGSSA